VFLFRGRPDHYWCANAKESFAGRSFLGYLTGTQMKQLHASSLFLLATALALAGCGRDSVKVYNVETSDTPAVPAQSAGTGSMANMANMAGDIPIPDNSGLPKLKFDQPAGWKEKPASQLRVASFEVAENGKTADVSVIPLSGSAGGDAANVNRWRGQVGLQPLPEAELQKLAEKIEVAGQTADLFDFASESDDSPRIVALILHQGDTAWFFKMSGDAGLVAKQKDAFVSFLKSLEFQAPSAPANPMAMDMSQLPPSHPPVSGMVADSAAAAPAADAKPSWTIPAGWEEGQLAQFLTARYVIKGSGDASAAVNVSQLSGDGGGVTANLNRWRGQLGQKPVSDEEAAKLPTIEAGGVQAVLTDFNGTDARSGKPARLVAVVLPLNGQTWFYKLMGDESVVGAQKEAFIQFVQSAKYPAGQ
jgi:hypothetical protein